MSTPTAQSPPASVPVSERIAQHLLATLGTITKTAGYSVNATAERPNPGIGSTLIDGRMILAAGDPQVEEDRPELQTQWLHRFMVLCEVVESEASATTIEDRLNRVRADVEFALTFDPDLNDRPNATRGGIAEDTMVANPIIIPPEPTAHDGIIIVQVDVRYRTARNNPFVSVYDRQITSVVGNGNHGVTITFINPINLSHINSNDFLLNGVTASGSATSPTPTSIVLANASLWPANCAGQAWSAGPTLYPGFVSQSGTAT